jgi:hypothetical protein
LSVRVNKRERMFAGELSAGTGAAENGLRWISEICGWPIIFRAAAFAIPEKKGAVGRAEEADELPFQNDATSIFYGGCVGREGISKSFIDFHPVPPDLSQVSS